MRELLFNLSFTALAGIVIAESMVLQAILSGALSLKRKRATLRRPPDPMARLIGSTLPAFRSRVLDSAASVTDEDVRSNLSMLFFVQLADLSTWTPAVLRSLILPMWAKVDGPLYVVCTGSDAECRQLKSELLLDGVGRDDVSVLIDEQRTLTAALDVSSTPCSVMFEPGGRIIKIGRPSRDSADDSAPASQVG